jgi:diguanylate cyclase (GGDEF)-like protein
MQTIATRLPASSTRVELYATDDAVAALDVLLATAAGFSRDAFLVELAWHLRQRDSERALELAAGAERGLGARKDADAVRLRLRLALVKAEALTLRGVFGDQEPSIEQARAGFRKLDDHAGEGDALLSGALLAQTRGDTLAAIGRCNDARACFERAGDTLRSELARAWTLFYTALDAPNDVATATLQRISADPKHAALDALLAAANGAIAAQAGDIAASAACYVRAAERARQAGMIRHAIVSATNAAGSMQELGDYDGAASLIEEALRLAQDASWPLVIGLCEIRLGEILRLLGHFEQSRETLGTAVKRFDSTSSGANKGAAYAAFGMTLLELCKADEAFAALQIAVEHFQSAGHLEGVFSARLGEARALSLAGRPIEALGIIEGSHGLRNDVNTAARAVALSAALADIYRTHALSPPAAMVAPTAHIHYLEEALAYGLKTSGWQAPASLLTDLSDAWGGAGDNQKALAYLRRAVAAERTKENGIAAARAITLESRQEARRSRQEAQHERELATIATARSMTLERDVSDRTDELARLRASSSKAADRIRALWRIAASDGLGSDAYLEAIVTTATHAIRPGRRLIAYLSELEGSTLTVLATDSTSSRPGASNGMKIPLQDSFEELLLKRNGTSVARRHEHTFGTAHPLTSFGWQEAVGAPVRVGSKSYFLVLASPQALRRDPFAEDDIAFIDVLVSFFAHRFAHGQQSDRIQFQMEHDALTGLRNRVELRRAIRAHIAGNTPCALCLIDIKDFSDVNEAEGYRTGDEVLVEVAAGLAGINEHDLVTRMGGDIFGILVSDVSNVDAALLAIEPYVRLFDVPVGTGDSDGSRKLKLTCSAGLALYPSDAISMNDLLQCSDAALDKAKTMQHSAAVTFDSIRSSAQAGFVLRRGEFADAIENDELFLEYQPTIDINDNHIIGAEALVRWHHPVHGDLQPGSFLPSIDRLSLLHSLSSWVLSRVARDLNGSPSLPLEFRCYFNLAPQQLDDLSFIYELREQLVRSPQLAAHLGVEVTETAAMQSIERSIQMIELIRGLGIRVAIDDFGTGYSSLNYLKQLPVDVIKIDRSFITGLPGNAKDATLTESLLRLSESFGMKILAEGIETEEQLAWLKLHKCHHGQGFLISRPIPFRDLEALLQEQSRKDGAGDATVPASWKFMSDDAASAGNARAEFLEQLDSRHVDANVMTNAELVFGELVGNVVKHAPGKLEIELFWTAQGGPVLIVRDCGPSFELIDVELPQDDLAESGRGFFLINSLGSRPLVVRRSNGGTQVTVALGSA